MSGLPLNALTPRARRSLVQAAALAQERGHQFVGTEHLLLALARDRDGIAGQVLAKLGMAYRVEEELEAIIASYKRGGEAPDPGDEVRVRFDPSPRSNHRLWLLD